MKKLFIPVFISLLIFLGGTVKLFASSTPTNVFTCSAISPSSTTATFTLTSNGSYNLSGSTNLATIQVAQTNSDTITPLSASSTTNPSADTKQLTYTFTNLLASTPYAVSAFDSTGAQIAEIPSCAFTTSAGGGAAGAAATSSSCSATNVINDQCYEDQCTGQSSEDSQSCNTYAQQYVENNDGNPDCASIDDSNETDCCANSDSPICAAYENYSDEDAANEAGVAGQVNSGSSIPAGSLSTAALNAGAGVTSALTAFNGSSSCNVTTFNTILDIAVWIKCVIGVIVIPGIFSLAFVVFLWGVFKFIRASEKTDKDEGKKFIYMGLIGLFVMVSVWGIIHILSTTLGISSTVPTLQTSLPATSSTSTTTPTSITPVVTN